MTNHASDNKRLVKNTLFLYIRMFLTMGIALYTSRVVLNVLGIEDYGIYNVVGGVVGILLFLNNTLSSATSRFLTFELARKDDVRLKKTFSSSLCIHLSLAVVMVFVLETIGLWFVSNKLTIPESRLDAALVVYHFSVFNCVLSLLQLPFSAAIISHEKMDAFAYISIFDVVFKLIIVYILQIIDFDKLEIYGILMFIVSSLTSLLYTSYSIKNFKECSLSLKIDKEIAKPMLSFSGWDLYGNFSVVVRSQGLNILQNIFFGPVINAATGIANQVLTAIMGFAENFLIAAKPQIVKLYAEGNIEQFNRLVINMSKYCTLLLFLISYPLFLEIDYVLKIWLVNVPEYAAIFCRLSIVNNWISILFRPIVTGIYATGNARRISVINGTVYFMVLPLSYILLKLGGSPIIPFVLNIILLCIGHIFFSMSTINKYVKEFNISKFYKEAVSTSIAVMALTCVVPLVVHTMIATGLTRFISTSAISITLCTLFTYLIALDKSDRNKIKNLVFSKISRNSI